VACEEADGSAPPAALGGGADSVALEWGEPLLLAKSTKGFFEGTDWAHPKARSTVLTALVSSLNQATTEVHARYRRRTVGERLMRELSRRADRPTRAVEEPPAMLQLRGMMPFAARITPQSPLRWADVFCRVG